MSLPYFWLAVGITTAFLAAFVIGFPFREQLTDLKPAVFYAAFMYLLSIFSNFFNFIDNGSYSLFTIFHNIHFLLIPNPEFIRITLRLTLIIQLSAFFFRTTSSLEIRESLFTAERLVRKPLSFLPFFGKRIPSESRFMHYISLFLMFIPEVFRTWTSINTAWKARAGKQGLSKIKTTVFILISLCMEKAALKARALEARRKIS